MGQSPSTLIANFQKDAEKEKKANDALQALMEMAKLQQDKFYLVVQANMNSQKLIPVDVIIRQENILQATSSTEITGVDDIINTTFAAFAAGDVANGVASIVQTGLNLLVGSYSGNISSRDSYVITAGKIGGIMRIDMHFFAYQFTSSQLTDICKQVVSVSVVVSSVDSSKLSNSTLRNIVQIVYGNLPTEDQSRILEQLETAARKDLVSRPDPRVVAAHLSRAVKKVGQPQVKNPITDNAEFTISTIMGEAKGAANRFQDYLLGGIVEVYEKDLKIGRNLVTASVTCIPSTEGLGDDLLTCVADVVLEKTPMLNLSTAGSPSPLLARIIQNLLQRAIDFSYIDLPIESFVMAEYPPVPDMDIPITEAQWKNLIGEFPGLVKFNRADFRQTDLSTEEAMQAGLKSPIYNCIAWSLENTYQWINPPRELVDFIQLYKACGYEVCSSDEAEVDGYRGYNQKLKRDVMTHGARQHDGKWSSKCGSLLRMTHPRKALEGHPYGNVIVSFKSAHVITNVPGPKYDAKSVSASSTKLSSVVGQLAAAFPQVSDSFKSNWQAWADSWLLPSMAWNQSASDYATGVEWDTLVDMGQSILPMVVHQLSDEHNIFGCLLYNQLQTDASKKISPTDLTQYYILNNQAKDIIKLYGDFVGTYEKHSQDWGAEMERADLSANAGTHKRGSAYKALLSMGSAIVPLVMYSYSSDKSGYWHELLNELVHGTRSDHLARGSLDSYAKWSDWFQNL
ncbi:hypothetical protein F4680DRAFT_420791 [Xylaria scruposa]|nr:hypothetical protein F4680DRAFT_420791 [Xylaria scruposa]